MRWSYSDSIVWRLILKCIAWFGTSSYFQTGNCRACCKCNSVQLIANVSVVDRKPIVRWKRSACEAGQHHVGLDQRQTLTSSYNVNQLHRQTVCVCDRERTKKIYMYNYINYVSDKWNVCFVPMCIQFFIECLIWFQIIRRNSLQGKFRIYSSRFHFAKAFDNPSFFPSLTETFETVQWCWLTTVLLFLSPKKTSDAPWLTDSHH